MTNMNEVLVYLEDAAEKMDTDRFRIAIVDLLEGAGRSQHLAKKDVVDIASEECARFALRNGLADL